MVQFDKLEIVKPKLLEKLNFIVDLQMWSPLPLGVMWGMLSDYSECLYRKDLGQIGILDWNWHFRSGLIFSGGTWIQISNKKNDSNCNSYNFSILVSYPNNFVVVCIFIFHGIYFPHPQFFCGWPKDFFKSCG